jgi:hypothetical protein
VSLWVTFQDLAILTVVTLALGLILGILWILWVEGWKRFDDRNPYDDD